MEVGVSPFEREVLEVGAMFEGRLPSAVLADALDYVQFNESGLALNMLCEQLVEYDVTPARHEYERLRALADMMYPDASSLDHLARQVVE